MKPTLVGKSLLISVIVGVAFGLLKSKADVSFLCNRCVQVCLAACILSIF